MSSHLPPAPLLPLALPAERRDLATACGSLSLYRAGLGDALGSADRIADRNADRNASLPPLLLLHSVNASASAAEMAPLFAHYCQKRVVYALELPGFGFSDRSDRPYTVRLMTDALQLALTAIQAESGGVAADVVALSLSCEFAARVSVETPQLIRRLAMVSPTGFSGQKRRYGPAGSVVGPPWLLRLLRWPRWSEGVYRTLTRPAVIRYFLARTWGSDAIDETLWRYDLLTTRQPGARFAPLYFVSAQLFSADINSLYEALIGPVWVSMATRGDFTDYQGRTTVAHRSNWQFHAIEGGALPYFEDLPAFTRRLDPFWD
jgi:pimeloyl-ACP methyl ester carboxylesterase